MSVFYFFLSVFAASQDAYSASILFFLFAWMLSEEKE